MAENVLLTNRSIVDDLKKLDVALSKSMAVTLQDEVVTAAQAGVLLFLAQRRGMVTTNRRIEERFNISNPAASSMVKRLEAKGLVTSSVDPNDKRCHCVSITDYGYDCMVTADRKVKRLDETIFAGFSPDEVSLTRELVSRILSNLQGDSQKSA